MQECPFCLQRVRGLGAVILMTPAQVADTSSMPPICGQACVDCLGLLSMLIDGLARGNIRQLADRLISNGAIRRRK